MPLRRSLSDLRSKWNFRSPVPGETEDEYRKAMSEVIRPYDPVEAEEVVHGPWDTWNATDLLRRALDEERNR